MRISDWSSDVCSSDLGIDDDSCRSLRRLHSDVLNQAHHHDALFRPCFRVDPDGNRIHGMRAIVAEGLIDGVRHAQRSGEVRLKSEEHTSELQSLMRISYDVFCLKKKTSHHTKP